LQKNWKTILYLLDEAQFVDADTPPKTGSAHGRTVGNLFVQ